MITDKIEAIKLLTLDWKNLELIDSDLCNTHEIYNILRKDDDFMKAIQKWENQLA
jgi:hypothetical protein